MKGNIFIKRPVMAISISVLILAIGLISLFTLPVEQYPDIAPPTVYVAASYTGADAEAVMNSVIMPLEESINGVEDMMYITSSASNAGLAIIQVYFKQGTDPDMAAVNVQNRVAKAQGLLWLPILYKGFFLIHSWESDPGTVPALPWRQFRLPDTGNLKPVSLHPAL